VYMSNSRHIVHTSNVKTVQQKYMKDKNEEEIGSAPHKERRKTQVNEVSSPFQQFQNL
jgi:hypothetical protein